MYPGPRLVWTGPIRLQVPTIGGGLTCRIVLWMAWRWSAPETLGHADPRLCDDEFTNVTSDRVAIRINDVHRHSWNGAGEPARLLGFDGGASHDATGYLGSTGIVNDRTSSLTDLAEEPPPCFRRPWFTARPKRAQRRPVVAVNRIRSVSHQASDRCRGNSEHAHPMLGNVLPQPRCVRPIGSAVVEAHRRAEQQWALDEPRRHHPSRVGIPANPVVTLDVEQDDLVGSRLDWEPGVDVSCALWLASGTRRVNHHVRVICHSGRGLMVNWLARKDIIPPVVATFNPRCRATITFRQATGNDNALDARC